MSLRTSVSSSGAVTVAYLLDISAVAKVKGGWQAGTSLRELPDVVLWILRIQINIELEKRLDLIAIELSNREHQARDILCISPVSYK